MSESDTNSIRLTEEDIQYLEDEGGNVVRGAFMGGLFSNWMLGRRIQEDQARLERGQSPRSRERFWNLFINEIGPAAYQEARREDYFRWDGRAWAAYPMPEGAFQTVSDARALERLLYYLRHRDVKASVQRHHQRFPGGEELPALTATAERLEEMRSAAEAARVRSGAQPDELPRPTKAMTPKDVMAAYAAKADALLAVQDYFHREMARALWAWMEPVKPEERPHASLGTLRNAISRPFKQWRQRRYPTDETVVPLKVAHDRHRVV
jgi:hypothetical protein